MSINFKSIKIEHGSKVLVNFHAFNSCKEDNQALMDFCAENKISYYSVDFPGQGDSQVISKVDQPSMMHLAKLASIYVNQINSDEILITGHSMGGAIAILVASFCYDKVERIIIENPISPNLLKNNDERIKMYDVLCSIDIMRKYINGEVQNVPIEPHLKEFFKELAGDLTSENFLKQVKRELSKIKDKHIDVILGTKDIVLNADDEEKYFEHIDKGFIHVHKIDGASHSPHQETPNEYKAILQRIIG